jgi:phosphoadenosine phosphosulfate reductase
MPLIENDLFLGTRDKVKTAIERLQHYEPPKGYCLAFSGGKDSIVVKKLVEMSGVKFRAYFNLTTVDPPEILNFVRQYHKDVKFMTPLYTMRQLIAKKLMPPTRIARYCCEYLKEGKGKATGCNTGDTVITGVRWAESVKRSKRRMLEVCLKDKQKTYLHPAIDWSDNEVWEFIKEYKLPYCKLYDEGFKRIGCIACPMSNRQKEDLERYPRTKAMYLKAFGEMIEARKAKGLPAFQGGKNAQEIMAWWTSNAEGGDPDQTILFE